MVETLDIERTPREDRRALLTVHEAAVALRLSEASIWRRVRSGELEAVRLGSAGSAVRILAASVRDMMRPYDEEVTR
jgi:excisionase family DNA binding protein